MWKPKLLRWALLLVLAGALWTGPARADAPTAGVLFFSTPECKPCRQVEELLFAMPSDCDLCQAARLGYMPLKERYGDQLQVRIFNPRLPEDYEVLLELEEKYEVRLRQVPALFIGEAFLEGWGTIRLQLPSLIEDCLSRGGCPFPSDTQPSHKRELPIMIPPPELLEKVGSSTPGVTGYGGTEPVCPSCLFGAYPVSAAYFYRGTDWREEEWSWFVMRYFLEERMNLGLRTFDVDYPHNETLWRDLCHYYGISEKCATPAVFIGAYAFVGEEIEIPPLDAAWKEYSRELMPALWELLEEGQPRPQPRPTTSGAQEAKGAEGVAHAAFFYSPICPHCERVEEEALSPLQAKYGPQLDLRAFNVEQPEDYEVLLDLEARYGVHIAEVPVIFMGDAVLEGEEAIREGLAAQIERCLQKGGCAPPTERQPGGEASATESEQVAPMEEELGPGVTTYRGTGTQGAGQPPVQMAYFFERGCQECDRAWYDLRHLLGKVANLTLRVYDIGAPENKVLNEALCQHYGVPEQKRLSAPALFVGDHYLLGEDITLQRVEAAYREYSGQGTPAPWELVAGRAEQARARIVDRFRSFGPYTVVAAGLIDGLNPCAFATIIFFISYLAISGRKDREIVSVGAAFTLGVFLAYLLVGVGLWKFLQSLGFLAALGRWVYLITALLCLFLAFFSLLDYRKARRGELEEMALNLPHSLRMRINQVIRQTRRARAYVWVAFITGLAVSIIELACTGQVYLPTIIFVMGVSQLRVRAFLYLLLYNLMFILPLVVVFILAFRGTTSQQLTRFLQARAATVKLAMSGLFFALAVWLLYTVFWG